MKSKSFHYHVIRGVCSISDLEYCSKSIRTFDISIFKLANNMGLLNLLQLHYLEGNFGINYYFRERFEWFCGYLASFEKVNDAILLEKKCLTNPVVRILIEDKDLLLKAKKTMVDE